VGTNQLWSAGTYGQQLVTSQEAWDFDVAVDLGGTVHIIYYAHGSAQIIYEAWNSGLLSRVRQAVVENAGGTPPGSTHYSGLSIAVAQGRVHVAYLDFTRGTVLRYAVDSGSGFAPETVAACDDVLGNTSLAIDSTGAPHIAFPWPAPSFAYLGYAVKRWCPAATFGTKHSRCASVRSSFAAGRRACGRWRPHHDEPRADDRR